MKGGVVRIAGQLGPQLGRAFGRGQLETPRLRLPAGPGGERGVESLGLHTQDFPEYLGLRRPGRVRF